MREVEHRDGCRGTGATPVLITQDDSYCAFLCEQGSQKLILKSSPLCFWLWYGQLLLSNKVLNKTKHSSDATLEAITQSVKYTGSWNLLLLRHYKTLVDVTVVTQFTADSEFIFLNNCLVRAVS